MHFWKYRFVLSSPNSLCNMLKISLSQFCSFYTLSLTHARTQNTRTHMFPNSSPKLCVVLTWKCSSLWSLYGLSRKSFIILLENLWTICDRGGKEQLKLHDFFFFLRQVSHFSHQKWQVLAVFRRIYYNSWYYNVFCSHCEEAWIGIWILH